jgi:hypothetical protein
MDHETFRCAREKISDTLALVVLQNSHYECEVESACREFRGQARTGRRQPQVHQRGVSQVRG